MMDYYCIFCGSEVEINPEDDEFTCIPCNKTFEVFFEGSELKGLGVKDVKEHT